MSGSLVGVVDENTYRDANLVPDTEAEEEPSETGNQEQEEGQPMLPKMRTSDKGLISSAQARRGREAVKLKYRKRRWPTRCRSHLGTVKTHCGVGDEAQWLKEHTARIEDPTLVSGAQMKCLTTARNSGSRESSTVLSLWASVLTSGHTTDIQTHRHIHTTHTYIHKHF